MSSPTRAIPVVCAVIERDGTVLIAQRPPHKALPLKWEFPGGKVEPGERAADALHREIREELGCDVMRLMALPPSLHDYGEKQVQMIPFVAQLAPGTAEPHAREHVSLRWIDPRDLLQVDLAAADLAVVGNYLADR